MIMYEAAGKRRSCLNDFLKDKTSLLSWYKSGKLTDHEYKWLKEELREHYKGRIRTGKS